MSNNISKLRSYVCIYFRTSVDIEADSSYAAQQLAVKHFMRTLKKRYIRPFDISVLIVSKDGKEVYHDASIL